MTTIWSRPFFNGLSDPTAGKSFQQETHECGIKDVAAGTRRRCEWSPPMATTSGVPSPSRSPPRRSWAAMSRVEHGAGPFPCSTVEIIHRDPMIGAAVAGEESSSPSPSTSATQRAWPSARVESRTVREPKMSDPVLTFRPDDHLAAMPGLDRGQEVPAAHSVGQGGSRCNRVLGASPGGSREQGFSR